MSDLEKLSDAQLAEVADFTAFLLSKVEESTLQEGIHQLAAKSKNYAFLEEDEVKYTVQDLKEVYGKK